ncbi:hypothetical protein PTKU46_86350 [Paraburkholderia terrae]|uniref:hypothetical protein n=1 Tax=Paraburkholderia terrae TaxID=311230 RepID=UPI0030E17192
MRTHIGRTVTVPAAGDTFLLPALARVGIVVGSSVALGVAERCHLLADLLHLQGLGRIVFVHRNTDANRLGTDV